MNVEDWNWFMMLSTVFLILLAIILLNFYIKKN